MAEEGTIDGCSNLCDMSNENDFCKPPKGGHRRKDGAKNTLGKIHQRRIWAGYELISHWHAIDINSELSRNKISSSVFFPSNRIPFYTATEYYFEISGMINGDHRHWRNALMRSSVSQWQIAIRRETLIELSLIGYWHKMILAWNDIGVCDAITAYLVPLSFIGTMQISFNSVLHYACSR